MDEQQARSIYDRFKTSRACNAEIRRLEEKCLNCGRFPSECEFCFIEIKKAILCIRWFALIRRENERT
jgi:hypothetical protein